MREEVARVQTFCDGAYLVDVYPGNVGALDGLRADLRAILSLLPSTREGWRDMDSAPKDGTRILINFDGAGPIVAYRDDKLFPTGWVRYLGYGKSPYWPCVDDDYALGWMPLPAAPSPSGEQP
jgi:hypothetical protein